MAARTGLVIAAAGLHIPEQRLAQRQQRRGIAHDGVVGGRRRRRGEQSGQRPDRSGAIAAATATGAAGVGASAAVGAAASTGAAAPTGAAAAATTGVTAAAIAATTTAAATTAAATTAATTTATLGEVGTATTTATGAASTATIAASSLSDTAAVLCVRREGQYRGKAETQTENGDHRRHVATDAIPFHDPSLHFPKLPLVSGTRSAALAFAGARFGCAQCLPIADDSPPCRTNHPASGGVDCVRCFLDLAISLRYVFYLVNGILLFIKRQSSTDCGRQRSRGLQPGCGTNGESGGRAAPP